MDNLASLEEKVMLLVQSIRKLNEEKGELAAEVERRQQELAAAAQEKEAMTRKLKEYQSFAAENDALRTKQEEARARVEQILSKLEKFEREIGAEEGGQTELMSEDIID